MNSPDTLSHALVAPTEKVQTNKFGEIRAYLKDVLATLVDVRMPRVFRNRWTAIVGTSVLTVLLTAGGSEFVQAAGDPDTTGDEPGAPAAASTGESTAGTMAYLPIVKTSGDIGVVEIGVSVDGVYLKNICNGAINSVSKAVEGDRINFLTLAECLQNDDGGGEVTGFELKYADNRLAAVKNITGFICPDSAYVSAKIDHDSENLYRAVARPYNPNPILPYGDDIKVEARKKLTHASMQIRGEIIDRRDTDGDGTADQFSASFEPLLSDDSLCNDSYYQGAPQFSLYDNPFVITSLMYGTCDGAEPEPVRIDTVAITAAQDFPTQCEVFSLQADGQVATGAAVSEEERAEILTHLQSVAYEVEQ